MIGAIAAHYVATTYDQTALALSPVWFGSDDASGAFVDAVNGRDAVATGTPTTGLPSLLPNGQGTAVGFSSGNYNTVAHHADYNIGSSGFSFATWLKVTDPAAADLQVFADKTNMSLGSNHQWYVAYENRSSQGSPQRLQIAMDLAGHASDRVDWDTADTPTEAAAGGLYVVTVDGTSGETILYWQGVAVTSDATASGLSTTATTQPLRIGTGGAGTFPFTGSLQKPAIFNYPLTPSQVLDLYQSGT